MRKIIVILIFIVMLIFITIQLFNREPAIELSTMIINIDTADQVERLSSIDTEHTVKIRFSDNAECLAVYSLYEIFVFDLNTGRLSHHLESILDGLIPFLPPHFLYSSDNDEEAISSVVLDSECNNVLYGTAYIETVDQGTIMAWQPESFPLVDDIDVSWLELSDDARFLAYQLFSDNEIYIVSLQQPITQTTTRLYSATDVIQFKFLPDSSTLVFSSRTTGTMIWQPPNTITPLFDTTLIQIQATTDGDRIIGETEDERLITYSFSSEDEQFLWDSQPLEDFAMSSDGTQVAIIPEWTVIDGRFHGSRVYILNAATGETIIELESKAQAVSSVTFNPSGDILAVKNSDSNLELWDIANNKVIQTLQTPNDFRMAAFDPSGRYLIVGGEKEVVVWGIPE